ncbi:MAG: metallophosphoesterase [Dehalococcoidia bacterium]|nr:metallophosphoesterase [Dehalococcoidia bacterium]
MKFVLFSDLHLDASFAGLGRGTQAGTRRRQALRDTLLNIVALAGAEKADAILCGGDLYEHESFTEDTMHFLRKAFADIHPMDIYLAPGNHDWMGRTSIYERADWTSNVHIFKESSLTSFPLDSGLTVWGAAHNNPAVTQGFLDGFPPIIRGNGVRHLALFHGSELGGYDALGEGKVRHAPFKEKDITDVGFDHAFLGHYHRARAGDHHTYPGNPCPLRFGEDAGRGAVIIHVTSDSSGVKVDREWRTVSSYQTHDISLDVTGCSSQQDVRDKMIGVLQGKEGCARITVFGEISPDIDLNLRALETVAPSLDALAVRVGPDLHFAYDFDRISLEPTVRGQFVKDVMETADIDDEQRRKVLISGLRALEGRSDLEVV